MGREAFENAEEVRLDFAKPEWAQNTANALDGKKFNRMPISASAAGNSVVLKGVTLPGVNGKLYGKAVGNPRVFYTHSGVATSPVAVVWATVTIRRRRSASTSWAQRLTLPTRRSSRRQN